MVVVSLVPASVYFVDIICVLREYATSRGHYLNIFRLCNAFVAIILENVVTELAQVATVHKFVQVVG